MAEALHLHNEAVPGATTVLFPVGHKSCRYVGALCILQSLSLTTLVGLLATYLSDLEIHCSIVILLRRFKYHYCSKSGYVEAFQFWKCQQYIICVIQLSLSSLIGFGTIQSHVHNQLYRWIRQTNIKINKLFILLSFFSLTQNLS